MYLSPGIGNIGKLQKKTGNQFSFTSERALGFSTYRYGNISLSRLISPPHFFGSVFTIGRSCSAFRVYPQFSYLPFLLSPFLSFHEGGLGFTFYSFFKPRGYDRLLRKTIFVINIVFFSDRRFRIYASALAWLERDSSVVVIISKTQFEKRQWPWGRFRMWLYSCIYQL